MVLGMNKFKEFWVLNGDFPVRFESLEEFTKWANEMDSLCDTKHEAIHVVEFSALDAANKEIERLRMAITDIKHELGVSAVSVWYSPELDVLVIKHPIAIDSESGLTIRPVEWDILDLVRAKDLRSKYKGTADIADLFDWVEIGEFE